MTETPTLAQRLRFMSSRGYWPLLGDEAAAALEAQAAQIAELTERVERAHDAGFTEASRIHGAQIAERDAQIDALRADAERLKWRPMRTAPKDGIAILVLVEGSDIPRAARWLTGTDDRHATEETMGPGWYLTWDGTFIQEWDGPRYWMHCPDDPDEPIDAAMAAKEP